MDFINSILIEINNREKSIIIWTIFLFILAMSKKQIRSSLVHVGRAFFVPKLFIPFLILSLYIVLLIYSFLKAGFWETYLLKDTLIWFFGFAVIMYVSVNKAYEEDGYFKKVLIDNFKLFIIIQFVVNMYVFSLPVELLVTPLTTFFIAMSVITEDKEKYKIVHRFITTILVAIGFLFVIFSFLNAFNDIGNFLSSVTFKKLVQPIILTLFLIPYVYLMAVAILYETIFIRLSIKKYFRRNLKSIKFNLITTCNVNLNRLKRFNKIMFDFDLSSKEGVALAMEKTKNK